MSSSMPMPRLFGFCATAPMSRPKRPRSVKCESMMAPLMRPRPGDMAMPPRHEAPPVPDTIVSDMAAAPAEVPTMADPSRCSASMCSSAGEPPICVVMRSWSPPVKKSTSALSSLASVSGA